MLGRIEGRRGARGTWRTGVGDRGPGRQARVTGTVAGRVTPGSTPARPHGPAASPSTRATCGAGTSASSTAPSAPGRTISWSGARILTAVPSAAPSGSTRGAARATRRRTPSRRRAVDAARTSTTARAASRSGSISRPASPPIGRCSRSARGAESGPPSRAWRPPGRRRARRCVAGRGVAVGGDGESAWCVSSSPPDSGWACSCEAWDHGARSRPAGTAGLARPQAPSRWSHLAWSRCLRRPLAQLRRLRRPPVRSRRHSRRRP
jgi:hypothetical protein